MRLLKSNVLLNYVNSYLVDSPQPSNLSYIWNFGSLLAICLAIQLISGILLSIHYMPSVDLAFDSIESIIRDVNIGWFLRYLHANTASFFFIFIYCHIARGIYFGSYKSPRTITWSIGVIILILLIAIAFLGYVLVYGQISLWGATVITNLLSALPWIGPDLVNYIWGSFSVSAATLNRFYSLHFLLPFVLSALVIVHIITLHTNGSNNPIGLSGNYDRLPIAPFFLFKDLVTIFSALFFILLIVFFYPNFLGHSDNYIIANSIVTPSSIVPEWYLLPFYCILRSIPNKLLGVLAIFGSLLILLFLPILDFSTIRGNKFRPLSKFFFWTFIANFFILMWLGSQHVEAPFILLGSISTIIYFSYFLIIVPILALLENTVIES